MSEDSMLKCLIAFILGWIISKHMGNEFSVGAPPTCSVDMAKIFRRAGLGRGEGKYMTPEVEAQIDDFANHTINERCKKHTKEGRERCLKDDSCRWY